jgi:hypothetical protein
VPPINALPNSAQTQMMAPTDSRFVFVIQSLQLDNGIRRHCPQVRRVFAVLTCT